MLVLLLFSEKVLGQPCTNVVECSGTDAVCPNTGSKTCQCPITHYINGTNCSPSKTIFIICIIKLT